MGTIQQISSESKVEARNRTEMKRFIISFIFTLLFAPAGFAVEHSLLARVTVYWASGGGGSDPWTRQHKCATGARLRTGHCAVDPRRIPYGSKVVLPDGALVAVDTGSAVRSRKAARYSGRTSSERNAIVIDRFFETKRQALSWANAHPQFMNVRVVSRGSQPIVQQRTQLAVNNPPAKAAVASQQPAQVAIADPQPRVTDSPPPARLLASNTTTVRNPLTRIGR
jgi:3D (Asp-Asp-Asp) domain-containing protein